MLGFGFGVGVYDFGVDAFGVGVNGVDAGVGHPMGRGVWWAAPVFAPLP